MSRLVLHIGTHKTATTHIQDIFYANSALLARHGIIIPHVGKQRGQHGLVCEWADLPDPYGIPKRDAIRAWDDLIETHADSDRTVFVSSEEFSRMFGRRIDMRDLRQRFEPFGEITVLCVLRNQAGFIQSVYQQVSNDRNPGGWTAFLNTALDRNRVEGLTLNYLQLYDHIRTGFAPEQVHLMSYESACAGPGGIVGAVLQVLQSDLKASDLAPFGQANSNVSPPPLATFVANRIAEPKVAPAWLIRMAAAHLTATLPKGRKSSVFSRREIEDVSEMFTPKNKRLRQRVLGIQPDFAMAPIVTPGRTAFRNALKDDFWLRLCQDLVK